MASLTTADLCIGIFSAIPNVTETMSQRWVLGDFLCTIRGVTDSTFLALNIISLLLLTIDRFIAIVHPLRYPSLMTLKRSKVITALFWVLTFVSTVFFFGILNKAKLYEEPNSKCYFKNSFNYTGICIFTTALSIILVLYMYILKVARRQARRIAAQNHIGNPPEGQNAPQPISTKSATTVLIITGALCICWMPQIIKNVLDSQDITIHPSVQIILDTFLFINSWLNVVIYYWRNRELRQALQSLTSSCCR